MKHGFIKAAAGTVRIALGDPAINAGRVIAAAEEAASGGARVLALPRLCLVGATMGDLTGHNVLVDAAAQALESVVRGARNADVLTILTTPMRIGAGVEECAVAIRKGAILGLIPFGGAEGARTVVAFGRELPYGDLVFCPSGAPSCKIGVSFDPGVAAQGATLTVVPMATPEVIGAAERRIECALSASRAAAIVFAEAGRGESTSGYVYGGHRAIAEDGEILVEGAPLTDGMIFSEIDVSIYRSGGLAAREIVYETETAETSLTRRYPRTPFVPETHFEERAQLIFGLLSTGLGERIERIRARTAVLGISGGLDSALALLVAVNAMKELGRPATDVLAVTMPCFGTSGRTLDQAERLMKLTGVTARKIDIAQSVKTHFQEIGHDPTQRDAVYENAQARERTQVLMDLANETGGLVVGTGDMSEAALGWATYNGDHMSMYNVNADIPKTLAKALVRYAAARAGGPLGRVLEDIAQTPVSPELLPTVDGEIAQKTEDRLGPYELHDFFLYYIAGCGFAPDKARRIAERTFYNVYDRFTIDNALRVFLQRFFSQAFKRNCAPDGVAVGSISLSPRAFEMPSDAQVEAWLADLDRD